MIKAVVTQKDGSFLKLGDNILKELKPKKLPRPKTGAFKPYYPKRKKKTSKSYKRSIRQMRKGVNHR